MMMAIYINRDGFNQKFYFDDDFLCRIAHEETREEAIELINHATKREESRR